MVTLPTFLPVSEAARKYGLDEARLRALIEKGKIRAGVIAGEMVVNEDEVRGEAIQEKGLRKEDLPEWKKYAYLNNVEIGLSEAATKYNIPQVTLFRWYKKGIITEIRRAVVSGGEKIFLNEQDVAYCAEIYKQRKGQGKWLFDSKGLPYKPKTGLLRPQI
ncbi:hypothetical protein ATHL_00047 [Anaerolinea thermolimosa]|uniref:hypothetical protein n=1 Tax=Anaerolinea thermolimosa TaxID=229919 RepID=UPI0007809336|nr:hypothetical protein [Anaerolinea thermolimosa]GAP05218.1 hypothetical protein ATHL_00047 [Anaerolinea thermolimosa]